MTGQTVSTLTCDRDTRPPVDGMRTVSGEQLQGKGTLADLLAHARTLGWVRRGRQGYCPDHS